MMICFTSIYLVIENKDKARTQPCAFILRYKDDKYGKRQKYTKYHNNYKYEKCRFRKLEFVRKYSRDNIYIF